MAMRRWVYSALPGKIEDNLQLSQHELPKHFQHPPKGKYLVKVLTVSLNPVDYKLPESPIESRAVRLRKPATPGMDFCGSLNGKTVCGRLAWPDQYGTLGSHILVGEEDFAFTSLNNVDAATLGIAPLTAYQSIAPYVKGGDRVVIFGGSGGVGTFSIQVAKLLGCYVAAICSSRNAELCRSLGADEVIDYTQADPVTQLATLEPFDLAVDNVGQDTTLHKRSAAFLRPEARFVLVSAMLGSVSGILSMAESRLRPRWLGGARNRWSLMLCQNNKQQLEQIVAWVEAGKMKTVVDEIFDFENAPAAIAKLRTGRARGKIVVKVQS